MTLMERVSGRYALGAAALLVVSAAGPSLAQKGEGVFAGLAGSWSGSGSITLSSGAKENIRCRATYQVVDGGEGLRQNLRCASDSYNFNLTSQVENDGGRLSGSWTESTRSASGSVSGRASQGSVQARVDGPGFSANLSLSTRGSRQTVSIRSEGTELTGVNITLARN